MGNQKEKSTLSKLAEIIEMYLIRGGDPAVIHKIIDDAIALEGK